MDDILKNKLSELYDFYCIALAEHGTVDPLYFIIKDKKITPIVIQKGIELTFKNYTVEALKIAYENKADAIALITEQDTVIGKAESEDIKALMEGKIRPSDHPLNHPYLVLTYINSKGKKSALYGKIETDIKGTKFIREQDWLSESLCDIAPWKK